MSNKEEERINSEVSALIWFVVFVYDTDINKGNVHAETAISGFIFVDYLTLSSFSTNGLLQINKKG